MTTPSILVVGVGFTGSLVLRYLATHAERPSFELQAGGRSASKLNKTIADTGLSENGIKVVIFDLMNADDVEKAVLGATVVISCAGPFLRYGTNIVSACAKHGRHYVDISAETWWQYQMIEKYDLLASQTGATIVPGSCFDSIPSDLVAYTAVKTLKSLIGSDAKAGRSTSAFDVKLAASGGSWLTMLSTFDDISKEGLKTSGKPFALSPIEGSKPTGTPFISTLPILSPQIIGGHFVMALPNTRIVRRSWGLIQQQSRLSSLSSTSGSDSQNPQDANTLLTYGEEFDYSEFMQMSGKASAWLWSAVLGVSMGLIYVLSPLRWFLKKFILPVPGAGPSSETLKSGYFRVTNITSSVPTTSAPTPRHVKTIMTGDGDPGYILGSLMVSESALLLLPHNKAKLTTLGRRGGLLTPTTAFGESLGEALVKTGRMTLSSEEVWEHKEKDRNE